VSEGRVAEVKAERENGSTIAWVIVGIVIFVLLAYYPVIGNQFVNYDDPSYVTANDRVKSGITLDSIRWAFSAFYFYNWHPVTWISHMLDVQLFGLDPMGHHLTNLVLHLANTLLLFALFKRMTGAVWRSALVAVLFAVHPLHVESVAWVSQRKDVLSTLFWLLAMLAYVQYARVPRTATYLLCVLFFILGLMSKPMILTLPFVMLLIDYWPLRRIGRPDANSGLGHGDHARTLWRLLREKVPFFLLSSGSALITFLAQSGGGAVRGRGLVLANAANALVSYVEYIWKMLWPGGLSVFYPYRPESTSVLEGLLSLAGVVFLSWLVLCSARRLRYLLVGWLWYLVTLVPVIGFVKIGDHALADRYTYVPLIGLFVIIIWGAGTLAERFHIDRRVVAATVLALAATCSVLTHIYAGKWHDSETLFRQALAVTKDNWVAHKNLGASLAQQGRLEEALLNYSESLRIWPEPLAYVSQGWLYLQLGQYGRAAEAAKQSIRMLPENNDKAYFVLGASSVFLGDARSASYALEVLRRSNARFAQELESLTRQGPDLESSHGRPKN
jgi:protein O-mannosyl-transferase